MTISLDSLADEQMWTEMLAALSSQTTVYKPSMPLSKNLNKNKLDAPLRTRHDSRHHGGHAT